MPEERKNCPGCGVAIGELHRDYCDVERCAECGGQYISCGCQEDTVPRIPWQGEWPGVADCRRLGWYAKRNRNGAGWVPCDKDDPEATEDLNRLYVDAVWDKTQGRFIRKGQGEQKAAQRMVDEFFDDSEQKGST